MRREDVSDEIGGVGNGKVLAFSLIEVQLPVSGLLKHVIMCKVGHKIAEYNSYDLKKINRCHYHFESYGNTIATASTHFLNPTIIL